MGEWLDKKKGEVKKGSKETSFGSWTCQQGETKKSIGRAYELKESRGDIVRCKNEIEQVCDHCENCLKLKRNPERLVVGQFMGRTSSEVVPLDFGELKEDIFLSMVGLFTHYCQHS